MVDAAAKLLTHNRRRVSKLISSAPGRLFDGTELKVTRGSDPVGSTVDAVESLIAGGVSPDGIVVLARVNAALAPVQIALLDKGVSVRPAIGESYLAQGGVRAALAWLRLATTDSSALSGADTATAARRPSRSLSPKVVEWMAEQRNVVDLERLAGRLADRDSRKILGFVKDLHLVSQTAEAGTTVDVLRVVRDSVGLDQAMEILEGSRRRLDRSAQTDDLDALVAIGGLHRDPRGFEAWLSQVLRRPGSPDGVMLATIHSVKGREWPHVVVHDVSAGLLPHRLADDVEEERRVLHVGLTRGSSSVTVVAGVEPSPFLVEMFEEWTTASPQVRNSTAPIRGVVAPEGRESGRRKRGPATTPAAQPTVLAAIGLEVEHGGHRGSIVAIDSDGVLIEVGRARVRIPFGSAVRVERRLAQLVPEPPSAEITERAVEALRQWRSERARTEGKPAYIYLTDATIDSLAVGVPTSMAGLAKIKGIGPAKLESYGEDLLAVLEAARDDS